MKSIYASKVIKQAIWRDFTVHFKSSTSKASYQTDIDEAMDYFHKDFLAINGEDAGVYFRWLKERVSRGEILPGTMAKKFRELHSFAAYIRLMRVTRTAIIPTLRWWQSRKSL